MSSARRTRSRSRSSESTRRRSSGAAAADRGWDGASSAHAELARNRSGLDARGLDLAEFDIGINNGIDWRSSRWVRTTIKGEVMAIRISTARLRLSLVLIGFAVAAIVLATTASGAAAPARGSSAKDADSLRSLAAEIGLRVGTAVSPFDLDTPAYTHITADQFSSVTPENEMKWQVVEPTRGTYDWSGGDRLVQFAQANRQLV